MKRSIQAILLLVCSFMFGGLVLSPCAARAASFSWGNPAGGNWSSPANWSSNTATLLGYPTSGDDVDIGGTLTGPVVVDIDSSAKSLDIDNSTTTLVVSPTWALTVSDSLANNGTVQILAGKMMYVKGQVTNNGTISLLSGTVASSGCYLSFSGTQQTLSGSGSIQLNSPPNVAYDLSNEALLILSGTVTQAAGHTIAGAGDLLYGTFNNQGLINANIPGQVLGVEARGQYGWATVVNSGTMEATNGGVLQLLSVNNAGGTILANAGTVAQSYGTITGGTLATIGSSLISLSGATTSGYRVFTWNNVTLAPNSVTAVSSNGTLSVVNGITNNGTILVACDSGARSGGGIAFSDTGADTLSGSGSIVLGGLYYQTNSHTYFGAAIAISGTLTQPAGHTISGAGYVGLPVNSTFFINRGLVNANTPGQQLAICPKTTNLAMMQATNGGILDIGDIATAGGTLESNTGGILSFAGSASNAGNTVYASGGAVRVSGTFSGGTILATGGTIQLLDTSYANIVGSTLVGDSQSTVMFQGGTLTGVTIGPNTAATVPSGCSTIVFGGIVDNGTITLGGTSTCELRFKSLGPQTISGSGSIVLGPSRDFTYPRIINAANYPLTQAAGHTICGAGIINIQQGGMANLGLINANVAGGTLTVNSSALANSGTLEATHGGILDLTWGVNNNAGTILASGGTVDITAVAGGTLQSAGSSSIVVPPSFGSQLSQVTIAPNTTVALSARASLNYVMNGITNNGTITVPVGMTFVGQQTLSGSGAIVMASKPTITMSGGVTTQAAGHSIAGSGLIQSDPYRPGYLANQGLINANVSGQALQLTLAGSNSGILEATSGGSLTLQNSIDNSGGTILASGGTVNITGTVAQLTGGTLTGGTWIAQGGSPLLITSGSNITTNQANIVLDGAGSSFAKINSINNNQGSFSLLNGQNFSTTGSLTNSGTIDVDAASSLTVAGSGARII